MRTNTTDVERISAVCSVAHVPTLMCSQHGIWCARQPEHFPTYGQCEKAGIQIRTEIRCPSREAAASAMEAAVRGGFRIVEFTLTIPGALDLVEDYLKRRREAA